MTVLFRADFQNTLTPEVGTFDNTSEKTGSFGFDDGEYYLQNSPNTKGYYFYYLASGSDNSKLTITFDIAILNLSSFGWSVLFSGSNSTWWGLFTNGTSFSLNTQSGSDTDLGSYSTSTWYTVKITQEVSLGALKIKLYIDDVEKADISRDASYAITNILLLGNTTTYWAASGTVLKNVLITDGEEEVEPTPSGILKYLNFTGLSNLVTDIKNWITARIPTKTSEITNDSGYITSSSLPTNYVTTNTTQTISGEKIFSKYPRIKPTTANNGLIYIQSPGITFGTAPSTTYTYALRCLDSDGTILADFLAQSEASGYTTMQLRVRNTDGTNVYDRRIVFNVKGADGATAFRPNADAIFNLGTSSYKWSAVYSNSYYLGSTAFGDIVTHNASEFLTSHQAVTNSAPTLAWGTTSTIGTVGGTALTVKMPANPNTNTTYSAGTGLSLSGTTFSLALTKALVTDALGYTPPTQDTNTDTKVTQTVTTGNTYYPLLSCATATNTDTETNTSRFSKGLEVNARYSYIRSANQYNTGCVLGTAPGSELGAGGLLFGDYNKENVGYVRGYLYGSGRTGVILRVYNKIADGAYSSSASAVSGYFRINYDTSGKYIDTDLTWDSDLTPLTNNTYTLGTSSLRWKEVYATTFYGALDGNATNVTGTVAIAHGGTGATTRLNAVKALTNENVGTNTDYFLTITSSWSKAGYCSVANAKTVLGLQSGAYAEAYVHPTTAGNKHIPSGGSSGQYLKYSSSGTATWDNLEFNSLGNITKEDLTQNTTTWSHTVKARVLCFLSCDCTTSTSGSCKFKITGSNVFRLSLNTVVGNNSYKQDTVTYGGFLDQASTGRVRFVALFYPYSTSISFTIVASGVGAPNYSEQVTSFSMTLYQLA